MNEATSRKVTKKMVIGICVGLAYLIACLYVLFDMEAQMPPAVAGEWLENYLLTFIFDLFVYRIIKCLFNMPAIYLVLRIQSSLLLKVFNVVFHQNVIALLKA